MDLKLYTIMTIILFSVTNANNISTKKNMIVFELTKFNIYLLKSKRVVIKSSIAC